MRGWEGEISSTAGVSSQRRVEGDGGGGGGGGSHPSLHRPLPGFGWQVGGWRRCVSLRQDLFCSYGLIGAATLPPTTDSCSCSRLPAWCWWSGVALATHPSYSSPPVAEEATGHYSREHTAQRQFQFGAREARSHYCVKRKYAKEEVELTANRCQVLYVVWAKNWRGERQGNSKR